MDKAFDCFLTELYDCAFEAFQQTDAGQLLHQQIQQMNDDIETNPSTREKEFTYACLETLLNSCGKESVFTYRQGLRDGIAMLKRLGVFS